MGSPSGNNGNGDDGHDVDLDRYPQFSIYQEVLREALGHVLAEQQRNWSMTRARMQSEVKAIASESSAIISSLRATIDEIDARFEKAIAESRVRDGVRGPPGEPGAPGEKGEPGPPGKLPIAKVWHEGITYEGEVRLSGGACWQATKDTAQAPGGTDWNCLATGGRDGASPKVRGTWREGGAYKALDVVALKGGSFIAQRDDPGPCPGDGWQMMAMPGKRGEKGERGERGPRGEQGAPGVGFAHWKIDRENYVANAILSDGTIIPLPLRELFEQFQMETS